MLTAEAQYGRDKHSSLSETKINLNGYTFRKRSCFMVIFLAPFTKVQGVVAVTLMSMLTLHIKVLRQSFLCVGQGPARQIILYTDRSGPSCSKHR